MEALLQEILAELKKMNGFFESMAGSGMKQQKFHEDQFEKILNMVPPEMRGMFNKGD